jgi:hypothetical protein
VRLAAALYTYRNRVAAGSQEQACKSGTEGIHFVGFWASHLALHSKLMGSAPIFYWVHAHTIRVPIHLARKSRWVQLNPTLISWLRPWRAPSGRRRHHRGSCVKTSWRRRCTSRPGTRWQRRRLLWAAVVNCVTSAIGSRRRRGGRFWCAGTQYPPTNAVLAVRRNVHVQQ